MYETNTRTVRRGIAIVLLVLSLVPTARASDAPLEFIPRIVFRGDSQGNGESKLFFKSRKAFHVRSHGYDLPDGTFRLDQATSFANEPTTKRFWIITSDGTHRFLATLSDASGPVSGFTDGKRLDLRYRVHGIFVLHQQLDLSGDGKTIYNAGRITLLGIPIGWLNETITRNDPN